MEFMLQFGYGMMGLSQELVEQWQGGTVILSPRDLEINQCARLSENLRRINGEVLFDPQFFMPHSDHPRLTSYDYWPAEFQTDGFGQAARQNMVDRLSEINDLVGASSLIVPGERSAVVNEQWLASQSEFLQAAQNTSGLPLVTTICLSPEAILSLEQISLVIDQAREFDVSGFYLVLEHPILQYLVTDPVWFANCCDLAAGLKALNKKVIIGYSNQQQIFMAATGVDAIASGNWMNVRSFPPDKFSQSEDIKRRSTWYYTANTFSEFTLPFLELGVRLGLRDSLRSIPETEHSNIPFEAPRPTASGWNEGISFRHFLLAMQQQAQDATRQSYEETLATSRRLLDAAEGTLTSLHSRGVTGQVRDFLESIAPTRVALEVLDDVHGPVLRRIW